MCLSDWEAPTSAAYLKTVHHLSHTASVAISSDYPCVLLFRTIAPPLSSPVVDSLLLKPSSWRSSWFTTHPTSFLLSRTTPFRPCPLASPFPRPCQSLQHGFQTFHPSTSCINPSRFSEQTFQAVLTVTTAPEPLRKCILSGRCQNSLVIFQFFHGRALHRRCSRRYVKRAMPLMTDRSELAGFVLPDAHELSEVSRIGRSDCWNEVPELGWQRRHGQRRSVITE